MGAEDILARAVGGRVVVMVGDLTEQPVDAIVNAANSTLLGGGGVDGAIHRRGGPAILEACREIRRTRYPGGLPTGEVVMTPGGALPARHVIHTVGPVYGQEGGAEPQLLANCYRHALELAREHGLATVALPAISTGVFGYPADEAAKVVSRTLADFLADDSTLTEVRLVFFSRRQAEEFLAAAGFDRQPG
jgi:O-acetyl-ADP-ribose deacetylase (regulator of RNase III)